RVDPGGATRGRARGELQPGRRFQGHLGAGREGARGPGPAAAGDRAGGTGTPRRRSRRTRRHRVRGAAVVLSRIAASLFWIGRYLERADDTARILDAFLGRLLDDPWSDEDVACRSLLAILGVADPGQHR